VPRGLGDPDHQDTGVSTRSLPRTAPRSGAARRRSMAVAVRGVRRWLKEGLLSSDALICAVGVPTCQDGSNPPKGYGDAQAPMPVTLSSLAQTLSVMSGHSTRSLQRQPYASHWHHRRRPRQSPRAVRPQANPAASGSHGPRLDHQVPRPTRVALSNSRSPATGRS
jgi:hypothetical protein